MRAMSPQDDEHNDAFAVFKKTGHQIDVFFTGFTQAFKALLGVTCSRMSGLFAKSA